MKKSVKVFMTIMFAFMLSLFCGLTLQTVGVNAETVNKQIVGTSDTHSDYTELSNENGLPTNNANYKFYLSQNLTLTKDWEVPEGNITLCLNGYKIETGSHSIVIEDNKTTNAKPNLTIEDCEGNGEISHLGKRSNLFNVYGGNLVINGGKYTNSANYSSLIYAYNGNIEINNGDLDCSGSNQSFCLDIPYSNLELKIVINNGDFSSTNCETVRIATNSGDKTEFKIVKGKFSGNINVFDVNESVINNNNPIILPTYEVIKIGDNYYYENGSGFNVYNFNSVLFGDNYNQIEFLGEHYHTFSYSKKSEDTIELTCNGDIPYCVLHNDNGEIVNNKPIIKIELSTDNSVQYDGLTHKIAKLTYDSYSLYNLVDYTGDYDNIDDVYNVIKDIEVKYLLKGSPLEVDPKEPGTYIASAEIQGIKIQKEFSIVNGFDSSITANKQLTKVFDNEIATVNLNDLTYTMAENEYTGSEIIPEVKTTRWFDKNFVELNVAPTYVGNYYVELTVNAYNGFSKCSTIESYTITKKGVSINWNIISFEYNGQKQLPVPIIDFYPGANTGYTLSSMGEINVGNYEISITSLSDSNYMLPSNASTTYSIYEKQVQLPIADNKIFTYNGNPQTYSLVPNNEIYAIFNNVKTLAGTYEVIVSLVNLNYKWDDNTRENKIYYFVINKKSVSIVPSNPTVFRYTGNEQKYYNGIDETLYTISNNSRTDVGEQNVIISLRDKDNYIWSNNSSNDIEYQFKILPKLIEKPGEDSTVFTYNGSEQTYNYVENTYANLYEVLNNSNKQTNAGEYKVKIALKDKVRYAWADSQNNEDLEYNFVINKANYDSFPATVKFIDKVFVYDGTTEYSIYLSNQNNLPDDISVTYSNNGKIEPGVYVVTANFTTTKSNYYNPSPLTAKLIVKWTSENFEISKDENLSVETAKGIYPTYHLNVAKEVATDKIKETLNKSSFYDENTLAIYNVYNVKLLNSENETTNFDGDVKVKVTVSKELLKSNLTILQITNGEVSKIKYEIMGDEVVFTTNNLSQFVFVGNYTYLTGLLIGLSALIVVFILAMVCIITSLKRQSKSHKNKMLLAVAPIIYAPLHIESALVLSIITAVLFLVDVFLIIILSSIIKKNKQLKKEEESANLSKKERTIKDSFKIAKLTNSNKDISKESIVEYLTKHYKKSQIETNHRENYVKNGSLMLADNHYVKINENGKNRKICFAYVYQNKKNEVLLLLKLDKNEVLKLKRTHLSIEKSNYPKAKRGEIWYSLPIDETYSSKEIFEILENSIKSVKK